MTFEEKKRYYVDVWKDLFGKMTEKEKEYERLRLDAVCEYCEAKMRFEKAKQMARHFDLNV